MPFNCWGIKKVFLKKKVTNYFTVTGVEFSMRVQNAKKQTNFAKWLQSSKNQSFLTHQFVLPSFQLKSHNQYNQQNSGDEIVAEVPEESGEPVSKRVNPTHHLDVFGFHCALPNQEYHKATHQETQAHASHIEGKKERISRPVKGTINITSIKSTPDNNVTN